MIAVVFVRLQQPTNKSSDRRQTENALLCEVEASSPQTTKTMATNTTINDVVSHQTTTSAAQTVPKQTRN